MISNAYILTLLVEPPEELSFSLDSYLLALSVADEVAFFTWLKHGPRYGLFSHHSSSIHVILSILFLNFISAPEYLLLSLSSPITMQDNEQMREGPLL
jgi:hypothetical protein